MDPNGLRGFGLQPGKGLDPWRLADGTGVVRVTARVEDDVARLSGTARFPPFSERPTSPAEIVISPAMARDGDGNYAVWDGAANQLLAISGLAARIDALAPQVIALPAPAAPVRDLAYGTDDVLYVAGGDGVMLLDTRGRFAPTPAPLDAATFTAIRLAAGSGAIYALDTNRGRLCRITGLPPIETGVRIRRERDDRFAAVDPNPTPLRAIPCPGTIPAGERAVALAISPEGTVAVLAVAVDGARLRFPRPDGTLSAPVPLEGPRFPHSIAWIDAERIAILADATALGRDGMPLVSRDLGAFVYHLPRDSQTRALGGDATLDALAPEGDLYPLPGRMPGPFANVRPGVPGAFYPRRGRFKVPAPALLARLPLPAHERRALLANFPPDTTDIALAGQPGRIDSGQAGTVWHRLQIEARVPPGSAVLLWLAATDGPPPPFDPAAAGHPDWFPHLLGDRAAVSIPLPEGTPQTIWSARPATLLDCPAEAGRSGLFSVLIQRAGRVVRTLSGRRLWIVAELLGDGRVTPVVATIRASASRLAHRDRHLPALYRERLFGPSADAAGAATGPDFLERFIALFEEIFTGIEERIVAAPLVTDARSCPEDALPWLASWVGLALEPGLPPARARSMLLAAPVLARRHGTLAGLAQSLDIATDGAVNSGRIVPLENFRLRRTMSTIIGARLADAQDPLTAGLSASGNALVGDTLILGDDHRNDVLALFRTLEPSAATARDTAWSALYDGLAHRATILVHDAASDDELRLVRRVAEATSPAHVAVSVVSARYSFLVAVASLVGVDTYLREEEPPGVATVEASRLGMLDRVTGAGGLAGGALPLATVAARPTADAGDDRTVPSGESFTLDGSDSRAAPGHVLDRFSWTLRQE